jgi:peptidoglycan hydrolase-like protein with peptidoglycan-binding domain
MSYLLRTSFLVVLAVLILGSVPQLSHAMPGASTISTQGTNSTLRQGARGSSVLRLQQLLINKSCLSGTADGVFGAQTQEALRQCQQQHGLTSDGVAGPATWRALNPGQTTTRTITPTRPTQPGTTNTAVNTAQKPSPSAAIFTLLAERLGCTDDSTSSLCERLQSIMSSSTLSENGGYQGSDPATGMTTTTNTCHNTDVSIIGYGYNEVLDADGSLVLPQGKPIQEGYTLTTSDSYISDHNTREYAQVFAYMSQIRDALICDLYETSQSEWDALTEVLTLNDIKTDQSLTGSPTEQFYSADGIYDHLSNNGPDFHPMMKFLEEAELELKCLAFDDFDFNNPEGANHCEDHSLDQGSGIELP